MINHGELGLDAAACSGSLSLCSPYSPSVGAVAGYQILVPGLAASSNGRLPVGEPARPGGAGFGATPGAVGQASTAPVPDSPVAAFRVLAHMGGGEHYPAETAAALVDAARRGYAVETDVRWTADGVAILMHQSRPTAPMACSRAYEVAKTSWQTLRTHCRAVRDGRRYPPSTFAEAARGVAAVPGAQLFAEVKVDQDPEQVAGFLRILTDNDLVERTVITSFQPAELAKMRQAAAAAGISVRTMLFVRDESMSPAAAKHAGLWAVAVRHNRLTAAYARGLHDAGIFVIAWTPYTTGEWRTAHLAGAEYVNTDRPGKYLDWLAGSKGTGGTRVRRTAG